jgi:hypothetical protein
MIINIPTELKDITIGQLMAYDKYDKTDDDIIRCFCGVENPSQIKLKEYNQLTSHINSLLQQEVIFNKQFKHKGVLFGFIPKLDDITGAEFIDLENYIANKEYHKVVSILYRPVIRKKKNWFKRGADEMYDIKAYSGTEQWSNEMMNVSCVYYLGSMVFFYNLSNELLNYMKVYSHQIIKE